MESKSLTKKIEEKEEIIKELDIQYILSTDLLQAMTASYKDLYQANNAKVNSNHIAGFSSLINAINANRKQKSDLQDDITRFLDLANITEEEETLPTEISGNKGEILDLISGGLTKAN